MGGEVGEVRWGGRGGKGQVGGERWEGSGGGGKVDKSGGSGEVRERIRIERALRYVLFRHPLRSIHTQRKRNLSASPPAHTIPLPPPPRIPAHTIIHMHPYTTHPHTRTHLSAFLRSDCALLFPALSLRTALSCCTSVYARRSAGSRTTARFCSKLLCLRAASTLGLLLKGRAACST